MPNSSSFDLEVAVDSGPIVIEVERVWHDDDLVRLRIKRSGLEIATIKIHEGKLIKCLMAIGLAGGS
jgi:hypothetical protein